MINQVSWLGLAVKDIEASTAFYRDKLGLTVDEIESTPGFYTQFKLNGGALLGLVQGFEDPTIQQSFDTALAVADVDAAYVEMETQEVELLGEPKNMPFGRTFLFRTPDGHVLRVFKPPSRN